jgi:hypothetical protein
MDGNATKEANLRAIRRLLDYAVSETRRVGLSEVGNLLRTANLIIGDSLGDADGRHTTRVEPRGAGKIRLVACRDARYKKENETKI